MTTRVTAGAVAATLAISLAGMNAAEATELAQCRKFDQIYTDGKDICEKLWGGAFKYVPKSDPDYELAYTMWFFGSENPNDAVSQRRIERGLHPFINDTDDCHLEYFHHDKPQTEGNNFRECHPWNEKACCKKDTIVTPDAINKAYGAGFQWDRCGQLSPACERFFVQEACFYECDVNAGLFRKFGSHILNYNLSVPDTKANHWELHQMPIQGDYCDSFFLACKDDFFTTCAGSNGSFFECANVPDTLPSEGANKDDDLSSGAIAGIIVGSVFGVFLILFVIHLIRRERQGNPVFQPITPSEEAKPRTESQNGVTGTSGHSVAMA